MENTLIIIGAGGHGKVVADIALKMNKWEEIYFLDNNDSLEFVLGIKVIGRTSDYIKYINDADIFVAVGNNGIRKEISEELQNYKASMATLIHPNSNIGLGVKICSGTIVMAGAIINPSTVIGKSCIINTATVIEHDNVIEDYVHVSPGVNLAGNVFVGESSWIGIGSNVINNIKIVNNSIVGAGSLVINDINEPGKYVGAPIRRISSIENFNSGK